MLEKLKNLLKRNTTKQFPTTQQDFIAYTAGAKATFKANYNTYVSSVEALERAIRVYSNVAAMANMKVYKDLNGELKPLKIKNIDLEFNINELDSQSEFIRKVFTSIVVHGAAFVIASQDSKSGLIMFYSYDPTRFKINAKENNIIESYSYSSEGGAEVTFKPEEVIYISENINTGNILYPISRLSALQDLLELQANMMKQQKDYYSAGGKSSVVISPKEPISAEKAKELKGTFDTFIQTTAVKAMFLNTDVDVETVSNAQTPNQIMEALTSINTQIVKSFGIPEYLLGDYRGYVSDAAVQTASRIFFQVQLKPIFKAIEHGFTKYLRNTLMIKNATIKFDYKDVEILEDNLQVKVDLAEKLFKLGALSINELRAAAEMLPLPDESANYHHLPAFLQSGNPVAIENYDAAIAALRATEGTTNIPNGSSGGADNQPVDASNTNNQGIL